MSSQNKACPIVTREIGSGLEILVFRHPLAGKQLVKGSIEVGETPSQATLRELAEESGVTNATLLRDLGQSSRISDREIWHFIQCKTPELPNHWTFHTSDDGGHLFDFFWYDLSVEPDSEWHETFRRAIRFVKIALRR